MAFSTFSEYVTACRAMQESYIAQERKRFAKADKLERKYNAAMLALNLHPLTHTEIADRFKELDRMVKDLPLRYSDNAQMRALYSAQSTAQPDEVPA